MSENKRPWPENAWPTAKQYRDWLLTLSPDEQVANLEVVITGAQEAAKALTEAAADMESGALIERDRLVKKLRKFAGVEFERSGPTSHRGAALWDVAAWLQESDWTEDLR